MDVEGTFEGKDISYMRETFLLCLLFPVYLLGLIQTYIPFVLVKKYVQKSFKRSVFWGSVKLLLGTICIGITNLALVLFFCSYFSISGWLGFLYLLCIGPIFIGFLKWREEWFNLQRKKLLNERAIQEIASERKILVDELSKIISI